MAAIEGGEKVDCFSGEKGDQGEQNVEYWCNRVDYYQRLYNWSDVATAGAACVRLTGVAEKWLNEEKKRRPELVTNWGVLRPVTHYPVWGPEIHGGYHKGHGVAQATRGPKLRVNIGLL